MKHKKITSAEKRLFPCAFLFTEAITMAIYKN